MRGHVRNKPGPLVVDVTDNAYGNPVRGVMFIEIVSRKGTSPRGARCNWLDENLAFTSRPSGAYGESRCGFYKHLTPPGSPIGHLTPSASPMGDGSNQTVN